MYYSPKKNLEIFIESKNEQIKSLKQKILGSRITYDDMQTAKSRLNGLKSSHINLQKQDHLQLKQVIRTSQQVVNDLMKKKARLQEQLQSCVKDVQETTDLGVELVNKRQKAEQFSLDVETINQKLQDKKQKKNIRILQIQDEITTRRKQLKMQQQINNQLTTARNELKSKITKANKDLQTITETNKRNRQLVKKQLQQISRLEFQQENDELRVQNLQLKIEKQEKNLQNLQYKIEAAQIFMQRFSEDRLIYLKQTDTAANLDALLKMCTESNDKKQKQQKQCQEEIVLLQKKIEKAISKRQQLMSEMKNKQEALTEIKQKGAQLKSILNSIFHQDSSVLKLLADKKVYQQQPVKKKPLGQTQTSSHVKQDMLDLIATSDNFFMTSQTNY